MRSKFVKQESRPCNRCGGTGHIYRPVPNELRQLREAAGVSLRGFARMVKFSVSYICTIELGSRDCPEIVEEAYFHLKPKTKGK